MLIVSDGADWTKNNPEVEFPHIQHIYRLMSAQDKVQHVHLPDEGHGYEFPKRKAVYPFLARYLELDLNAVSGTDGNISEERIVIEPYDLMKVFTGAVPRPSHAVLSNDDVKW
jgi:uncharacterized protein